MLWKFWQNPEFIRHCRSELRRNRMTTVALVVFFVCGLTILACWVAAKAQMTFYHSQELVVVKPPIPSAAPAQRSSEPSYAHGLVRCKADDSLCHCAEEL
jgi:hypothetical protein